MKATAQDGGSQAKNACEESREEPHERRDDVKWDQEPEGTDKVQQPGGNLEPGSPGRGRAASANAKRQIPWRARIQASRMVLPRLRNHLALRAIHSVVCSRSTNARICRGRVLFQRGGTVLRRPTPRGNPTVRADVSSSRRSPALALAKRRSPS